MKHGDTEIPSSFWGWWLSFTHVHTHTNKYVMRLLYIVLYCMYFDLWIRSTSPFETPAFPLFHIFIPHIYRRKQWILRNLAPGTRTTALGRSWWRIWRNVAVLCSRSMTIHPWRPRRSDSSREVGPDAKWRIWTRSTEVIWTNPRWGLVKWFVET